MNDAELELYIYRILSGKLVFYFNGEKYELINPTPLIRYEANLLYDNIINDEKYEEWIREENLPNVMINTGLWNRDTMGLIKELDKKIENAKVDLYKASSLKDRQKNIRKNLSNLKNQYNRILNLKSDFFTNTLEGYAASIKNEYIISKTLYKNQKLILDNIIAKNQTSLIYFNDLVNKINKYIIDIPTFKIIARSQLWRSYWNAGKDNIFAGCISEWTDDQRTLTGITKMYDSVYEHPECPNDDIIADDDMLDGWMIVQRRKNEKAKNENRIQELSPHLKNAQEVFLMSNNTESFEEIISLNAPESLYRMNEKLSYVKAQGSVPEHQLPDVQRDLRNKSDELLKNRK
jgi:hypothetical protein